MSQDSAIVSEVLAANLAFYDAFGSLDIGKMSGIWENSDRVMCIHPSWGRITGWDEVRKSWERIFRNTSLMHFNITGTQVMVRGDCAWISCVENITSVVDGRASDFAVQATNILVRGKDGWRVVHHHASA